MIRLIYNLIIYLVDVFIGIPALFNSKLKLGVNGRKETIRILQSNIKSTDRVIWMHVASLGEFEQGRPVLEQLKLNYPNHKILLSFFSPSGYEMRKDYELADVVCYLPLDTKQNARQFIENAHPELVLFVKYEFWPNYLKQIKESNCKSILISTVIQKDNKILKHFSSWFREMMSAFDHILTQDDSTFDLLDSLDLSSDMKVSGDTRIDRTLSIANRAEEIYEVATFCKGRKTLIAGSTWTPDESHLLELYNAPVFDDWKLIIAPHDIGETHVKEILNRFPDSIRYSQIESSNSDHRVLVIDNIGLLNRIYRYGHIAYIGGGFGTGIHNTLEPAAFGLPIIIGPKFHKFVEAKELVATGGVFVFKQGRELVHIFISLQTDQNYGTAVQAVKSFTRENEGATNDVMDVVSKYLQC